LSLPPSNIRRLVEIELKAKRPPKIPTLHFDPQRLRRDTAIESGLFKIKARHLLQFSQRRQTYQEHEKIIDSMCATEEDMQQDDDEPKSSTLDPDSLSTVEPANSSDDLTRAFVRLSNLPTYPLDRLSRYEATLWRQACQILFTLECLDRRKPWERRRLR
jgi:hypothetical protein